MDLSLSVFHIFSDGAVDTRVYSIYGPEYRAPYKFSLLLLLYSCPPGTGTINDFENFGPESKNKCL